MNENDMTDREFQADLARDCTGELSRTLEKYMHEMIRQFQDINAGLDNIVQSLELARRGIDE